MTDFSGWSERMSPERRAAARRILEETNERNRREYEAMCEDRDRWRKSAVEVLANGRVWWVGEKDGDFEAVNDEEERFSVGKCGYGDFAASIVVSVQDGAIPLEVMRVAIAMFDRSQELYKQMKAESK